MESHARHIVIGFFVLVLAAVGIGFALWLGNAGTNRGSIHYRVMFDEPVTGLSVGSAVQYSGIKVGEIVSLSLSPEDPRRAIARVRLDPAIPIRQDTRAELEILGITGNAVIQLRDGGPKVPLLTQTEEEEPLIIAPRSALASLASGEDNSMATLNGILLRTRELLSDKNLALVHGTLVNLEKTTSSIAGQREDIAALIANLNRASLESAATFRQANLMVRDAHALLNEDGRQAMASTREAMASLELTSARIEKLIQRNQASLDQGMAATGPAMRELQIALSNLNTVLRRFDRNPAEYLLSGENIEETTP